MISENTVSVLCVHCR